MEYTTNLNLKKPGYSDPVDIKDLNDNFDAIDKLGDPSSIERTVADAVDAALENFKQESTKTVLWSGNATPGSTGTAEISLSSNPADFDYFEITGNIYGSYPFKVLGVYSPSGYDGAGINAHGSFYSSGGFFYHLSLYISEEGIYRSHVEVLNSSSSSSVSAALTEVIGYKF